MILICNLICIFDRIRARECLVEILMQEANKASTSLFLGRVCTNTYCTLKYNKFNVVYIYTFSDPPGKPQNPAAVEIPLSGQPCVILIKWDPPSNINSQDISYYTVHTASLSEIDTVNETSTLVAFPSPCKELQSLYINVTAVDRCGREGDSANIKPSISPPLISTTSSPLNFTTSTPIPCELYI